MKDTDFGALVLYIIIVTGGPCGGKSSAVTRARVKLGEQGIPLFLVPEIPTSLITNGLAPGILCQTEEGLWAFQQSILELGLAYEKSMIRSALKQLKISGHKEGIIIMDRGFLDGEAYMNPELFAGLLKDNAINRDKKLSEYNGIIILETAAKGAAKHYTLANNKARSESAKLARERDTRVQEAYVGNEHLTIITNKEKGKTITFERKLQLFLDAVFHIIGIPAPIENERKFELQDFKDAMLKQLPGRLTKQRIEQSYLPGTDGTERRIRKIVFQNGKGDADFNTAYVYTEKETVDGNAEERPERQRLIQKPEYESLHAQRDPGLETIVKMRHNFILEKRYFHLDKIVYPALKKPWWLEYEFMKGQGGGFHMPAFLGKYKEITGKKSNYGLAQGKYR